MKSKITNFKINDLVNNKRALSADMALRISKFTKPKHDTPRGVNKIYAVE